VSQSWYGASRWKEKSDEEAKKRGKEMDLKKSYTLYASGV
jgi:hypothetical protein